MLAPERVSSSKALADLVIEVEKLRVSESRYRRLFETARDGILLLNADTAQIEDVNPYLVEMLGYTHKAFLGKKLWEVGPFADIPKSKEMFAIVQTVGYVRYEDLPLKTISGKQIDVEFISNSYDCDGIKTIQCNIRDITHRKAAEAEIVRLAFYDVLTDLPNRRLLLDRLKQALSVCIRNKCKGALLFIDLDNFKGLNDTFGHDVGDLMLRQVAERLSTCVRDGDTVARLGGDEFVVMLEGLGENSEGAAARSKIIGDKIIVTLGQPYTLASRKHHGSASIGATLFGGHGENVGDLLKQADIAMYQAKAEGRDNLRFFDHKLQDIVQARAKLEEDLRQGILENQFSLHYQPQVDDDGCVTGAEALVRWQRHERGLVHPIEFIPLAEETGLILPLGSWVLETACKQLVVWASHIKTAQLTLAVNVSASQFHQPDFVSRVQAVVKRTGADPSKLKLELTESILLENVENVIDKMTKLKERGIFFSLDDFGTGYSSLSYLKRLPLSQLKIDQSFVRDLLTDANDFTIGQTIVALGRSFGLTVIAEGVETEAQRELLAHYGCHAYQGYLFGRPTPIEEFERHLNQPGQRGPSRSLPTTDRGA
jgi:diguanylate cyclase (GGDEF)-like protein/PAS domain S-box-containing protein